MNPKSIVVLAALISLAAATGLRADSVIANSQLRRTVDPSERSAAGTVSLRINNAKQTATIEVKGLAEENFGIFVGDSPKPSTNDLLYSVAPLDRTSIESGKWSRRFNATPGAPIEFLVPSLQNLAGGILVIAKPDAISLVQGVTNIVNGVTNVIFGIPLTAADTTNVVFGTLWAPISALVAKPSDANFHGRNKLAITSPIAPSPKAAGTVAVQFDAKQGHSVLDVRATHLTRGQTYKLFIGDSTNMPPLVMVPAGDMKQNDSGSTARFLRDTKFGDPLPEQKRDVIELSGRRIEIRDKFEVIHLEGKIP